METMYAAQSLSTEAPYGLEGVWGKLRGAETNIQRLRQGVEAYLGMPPYRLHRVDEDGWERVTARMTFPPPLAIGVTFGDVLHCLDSALDHTAWAFARTVADPPHKRTEWPSFGSAEYFNERRKDALRDIPPEILAVMADVQGNSDHDIGSDIGRQIALMRSLSNMDKHQVIPVVSFFVGPQAVAFHDSAAPVEWLTDGDRLTGYRIRRDVADVLRVQEMWHATVTIERDDLPWRSGLEAIARHFYDETASVIAALKPHWPLLRALPEDASSWWRGG